jgi:hypothetical protein
MEGEHLMAADTGKPPLLTEPQRAGLWRGLGTLARTATGARELVASDERRSAETMLIDIAAMEAILRRMRQSLNLTQDSR